MFSIMNNIVCINVLRYDICDNIDETSMTLPGGGCRSRNTLIEYHGGAVALFIISEVLQGMAVAPKVTMSLTYIDDNSKNNSPTHFGMFKM